LTRGVSNNVHFMEHEGDSAQYLDGSERDDDQKTKQEELVGRTAV